MANNEWITNEKGMRVRADFYAPALSTESGKIDYSTSSMNSSVEELKSQEEQLEQDAQARPKNLLNKYMLVETRDHEIKSEMYARGKKEGWSDKRVLQEIENAKRKADALLAQKLLKAPMEAKRKLLEAHATQNPMGDATKFGDKAAMDNMLRLVLNMPPEYLEQLKEKLMSGESENV
jgi:hypothetical protein